MKFYSRFLAILPFIICFCLVLPACDSRQAVEIKLTTLNPPYTGRVYVGGAVNSPGYYPFRSDDTLSVIIQFAGGLKPGADISQLRILPGESGQDMPLQKIDINRAEGWLLEALPGIGPVLARNIIDHREQNGPFRSIYDLLDVSGIGQSTLDKIKDYITVSDME